MVPDDFDGREPVGRFPDLTRFRFELRALDIIQFPEYPGSTWRGLLGHGLRQTACVTRQPTCAGCLLTHACVYSVLFETPPPPGKDIVGFTAMPHPFSLDIDPAAPRRYLSGDRIDLGVTLFGSAIAQIPYLIHALESAGKRGVGRDGRRFCMASVHQETGVGTDYWDLVYDAGNGVYLHRPAMPMSLPPAPDRVRLRMYTPLRIKSHGHFVVPQRFALIDLLRNFYNRFRRLASLYGGEPETFDWAESAELVGGLRLDASDLRWHDWTRYSGRQRTLMQFGGLLGDLTISGPSLAEIWPVLWVGQWAHVGKGTSFGLGAYRVEGA